MSNLENKVAIVTGGASGIGESTVRRFVKEGAKVVVADIADEGKEIADELGENARFLKLDVSDEENWKEVVKETEDIFGPIDILVNNAGIFNPAVNIAEYPVDDFKKVMEINQVGVFLGMKSVYPSMVKNDTSSIINVSSTAGLVGLPGQVAYNASKFAVRGMTKTAAKEMGAEGIRVNSVHPGTIATGIDSEENQQALAKDFPLERVGEPDEISNMIVYLSSDESSYSTGAEFVVDAGWTS